MRRPRLFASTGVLLSLGAAVLLVPLPQVAEARYAPLSNRAGEHADTDWGIVFPVPAAYEALPTPPLSSGASGGVTASFRRQEQSAFAPRFNLVCAAIPERFPGDTPPPDAEDWMLQAHTGESDFHPAGRARFRVAGQEAVAIAFTEREPTSGLMLRGRAVAIARNRVLYIFTFAAVDDRFAEEGPRFEKVLQGVRWLTPAGEIPSAAKTALARAAERRHFIDPGFGLTFSVPDGYVRQRSTPPPAGVPSDLVSVSYLRPEAPAGPNLPPPARPQNMLVVEKGRLFARNEADAVPEEAIQALWNDVEKQPAFERLPEETGKIDERAARTLHFRYQNIATKRMVRARVTFVAHGRDLYRFILACDAEETYPIEELRLRAMLEGVRFSAAPGEGKP